MATLQRVRWHNFRGFADSGDVPLAPLTIVVGANAAGKTSLIAPLLLLKQTLESSDKALALKSKGRYFNAGTYRDFVFGHDLARTVRFELDWSDPRNATDKPPPLRIAPPSMLRIEYVSDRFGSESALQTWALQDSIGRVLVERRRQRDGNYSVSGVELGDATDGWSQAIRNSRPEGFLFTPSSVLATKYRRNEPNSLRPAAKADALGAEHNFYLQATGFSTVQLQQAFHGLNYLGPLRVPPKRAYELGGESPFSVGSGGQFAPELIFRAPKELRDKVDSWIERFDFGRRVMTPKLGDSSFSMMLQANKRSTAVNAADTGFGFSQVLPLIVQSLLASSGQILVAEQPEIHLNPRLQGLLGDLFVEAATPASRILIETHSEHLVLRVRRLIAEGRILNDAVALYFLDRVDGVSRVRRVPIDSHGHVARTDWPKGFFEDGLREAMGLAAAQSSRRSNA